MRGAGIRLKSPGPRTISLWSVLLVILTMFLPPAPFNLKPTSEPSAGPLGVAAAAAAVVGVGEAVSAGAWLPTRSAAHAPAVATDTTSTSASSSRTEVRESAPAIRSDIGHLRHGHAPDVDGAGVSLAVAELGLGHGVAVAAAGLAPACELPGAAFPGGAPEAAGAWLAAGLPPGPPAGCVVPPLPPAPDG